MLGEADNGCHRQCVQQEIDATGQHEQQRGVQVRARMQWAVIDEECPPNREGRTANVEQHLFRSWPAAAFGKTLQQNGSAAREQGLTKIQLDDANKNKEEADGDGAGYFRQAYPQP